MADNSVCSRCGKPPTEGVLLSPEGLCSVCLKSRKCKVCSCDIPQSSKSSHCSSCDKKRESKWVTADTLEKRDREMAAKFQNMESKQDKMFALLSELSKQSSCSSAGFDEPRAQVQVVDDQYEGCGEH